MGRFKELEIVLNDQLVHGVSISEMVICTYRWLWANKPQHFCDVAHMQDTAVDLVGNYVRRHWLRWYIAKFMKWLSQT